jgi:hypothetical protein
LFFKKIFYFISPIILFLIRSFLKIGLNLTKEMIAYLSMMGWSVSLKSPDPTAREYPRSGTPKSTTVLVWCMRLQHPFWGGNICWVNGPFPAGSWNDWKIFNMEGLKSLLEEH